MAESESDLEASAKGIAAGIAGKLKEMAGELMEDQELEEEGIVQQLDGEIRRAQLTEDDEDQPAPRD
jgi:uncharacterized protein YjbJ (UPF0337 family)